MKIYNLLTIHMSNIQEYYLMNILLFVDCINIIFLTNKNEYNTFQTTY